VFTVKQASQELGVSESLLYNLCKAGRIRHERYGLGRGTIRISRDALDEYRKGCAVDGASVPHQPQVKPQRFQHLKL
jgi:excisionase family DNA binding protein